MLGDDSGAKAVSASKGMVEPDPIEILDGRQSPAAAEIQKFRGGKLQHWFFGCDWPHFCDFQDDRKRLRPGGIFEDPNQRYLSNAIFEDGVVVNWGS